MQLQRGPYLALPCSGKGIGIASMHRACPRLLQLGVRPLAAACFQGCASPYSRQLRLAAAGRPEARADKEGPNDRVARAREIIEKYSKQEAGSGSQTGASDEPEEYDSAQEESYKNALVKALRLVNYRERSAKELLTRLQEDGHPQELAQAVVQKVQRMGLQDDARFAEAYARAKWRTKASSPQSLKFELARHGVSPEGIQGALSAVFGTGGDLTAGPEHEADGQQNEAWAMLMEKAARQADMSRGDPWEKQRAKMVRWLQYRGHNWKTVKKVLWELGL